MFAALTQRFTRWLFRPKIEQGTIILTQRRIFILPTRSGLFFGFVLILMLLGDINYNLSLGYVLTFLLAMMAVMSMLFAFRNLAHLEVSAGRAKAVFCGETAYFPLSFDNPSSLSRYQLTLRDNSGQKVDFDVLAQQASNVSFPIVTQQRGWLPIGQLTLSTEFPLGLFYAWSYLHFDAHCLIHPKPLLDAPLPTGNTPNSEGKHSAAGDDDFAGLRNYVAGDALPRIAWKAYARGLALQVKQFSTPLGEELWLNFADTPDPRLEDKLSRMTRWIVDAEARGLRYGLKLPDAEIPVQHGAAHCEKCLRQLALFKL